MPQRPSNREMKALYHLGEDNVLGPDDFKDVGEKVFAGMLKKQWIEAVKGQESKYRTTEKGRVIHDEEVYFTGRWKR
ncbi:MAG TPA: hypothetical protein VGN79_10980 [Devosia sp.]|jgi:hypothetical protein|nr:hypothetical protein [Devosia sp.]